MALKASDYPNTSKQVLASLRQGIKDIQKEIKKVRINSIKK
jgi:hypothetical protein